MAELGNVIWFILFGWWSSLLYLIFGGIWCATIIGIPIGKALFQYAKLMAFPFGKEIVRETFIKGKENVSGARKVGGVIANIIWFPVGLVLFILLIVEAIISCITIILIPIAVVQVRCARFILTPIGAKVIRKDEAQALRVRNAMMAGMNNNPNPQYIQGVTGQVPQTIINMAPSQQYYTDSVQQVNPVQVQQYNPAPEQNNMAYPQYQTGVSQVQQTFSGEVQEANNVSPNNGVSIIEKYCEKCGAAIKPGWKFCNKCGASMIEDVAVPEEKVPEITGNVCKSCGAVLMPGWKFCNSCGAQV